MYCWGTWMCKWMNVCEYREIVWIDTHLDYAAKDIGTSVVQLMKQRSCEGYSDFTESLHEYCFAFFSATRIIWSLLLNFTSNVAVVVWCCVFNFFYILYFLFFFSGMTNKRHPWSSWENKQKTSKQNGAITAWEVILRCIKGQSSFLSVDFPVGNIYHLQSAASVTFVSILSITKNWIILPYLKNHSSIFKQYGGENLCAESFGGKFHTVNAVSYGY